MCGLFGSFGTVLSSIQTDLAFKSMHHRVLTIHTLSVVIPIFHILQQQLSILPDLQHGRQPLFIQT